MITRRLPVRSCRVVDSSEMAETHHTVQCPRRDESAPFERCCGCEHMKSIPNVAPDGKSGTVECVMNGLPVSARRARVDVAKQPRAYVSANILGTETTCVRPADVRLRDVTVLLTGQARRAVPVVDESRRLVGIVSRSDLLSKKRGERRKPLTVADIMTPVVHGLPEQAPVAYAIAHGPRRSARGPHRRRQGARHRHDHPRSKRYAGSRARWATSFRGPAAVTCGARSRGPRRSRRRARCTPAARPMMSPPRSLAASSSAIAEEPERSQTRRAPPRGALADAAGEHERVEAAEHRRERADRLARR